MLNKYGRENLKLMFTDTGSLLYKIKAKEAYVALFTYLKDTELFGNDDNGKVIKSFLEENKGSNW